MKFKFMNARSFQALHKIGAFIDPRGVSKNKSLMASGHRPLISRTKKIPD